MVGVFTIAKWELLRSRLDLSTRSLIAAGGFVVAIAVIASFASHSNMGSGLYTISLDDANLAQILGCDDRFNILLLGSDDARDVYLSRGADILIIGGNVSVHGTEKSVAALDALKSTMKRHREIMLSSYSDLNNSFPVWITIHHLEREQSFQMLASAQLGSELDSDEDGGVAGSAGTGDGAAEGLQSHRSGEDMILRELEQLGGATPSETDLDHPAPPADMQEFRQMAKRNFLEKQTVATPSNIEPPIPFTSVIFAFVFMFPMYFVAQFYSASVMNERTNRSGEFLLVSPLTRREIVAGKTLPYLIITLAIMFVLAMYLKYTLGSASITEILKSSLLIVAVMIPVVSLFLSFSLFSSILARSFKELTFVSVFFSTIVSGYLFFPAMFAHIHAIALISPMTLVVKILTGTEIYLSEYLFSTVPFYCVSIATFGFATLIFREEDLFTQKTVKKKIVDCIELFLRKRSYLFLLTLILIPFAYMFELMLIVLLFNIPLPYSIIAMICISALIEEVFKSAGVYTLSLRGYTGKQAIILAVLAGSGFFVGEKLMVLVTVASIADSVFGTILSMGSLLIYPLLLHIGCVAIVAFGLRYQRYSVCLLAATAVHVAYNFFLLRGFVFA
ncbi:MAG: ABC transporter permease [Methanosarcinales archaeon]|nr:MAG: ABC transporter permease [Methanosarcinales archaeon]